MLPIYKIVVTEHDDLGIDFNSFVDRPAHMKDFIAFGKDAVRLHFDEEKRIVTGVMISVGTLIYRRSDQIGEYYTMFDEQTTATIREKFHSNGFTQNVNLMHDMKRVTKGAILIDSYIVKENDPRYPKAPEAFKHMKLKDGSWIASYKIKDNVLWDDVKSGKFKGFSVEGWFDLKEVQILNKHKMSKKSKSIFDFFKSKFDAEPIEVTFAEATTADGTVVFYDGELGVGTALLVEVDGERVPAPVGEHQLTINDGTQKIVVLDDAGVVTEVMEVMENETEMATKEEVAEFVAQMMKDTNDRFIAIENENKTLKEEIEVLKEGGKFGAQPKKTGEAVKKSASEILFKK